MQFLYVPRDDLQQAKKKIVKKMRKNAENEPKYAMTTDQALRYDEYISALIDLNDRLYTFQVELDPESYKKVIKRKDGGVDSRQSSERHNQTITRGLIPSLEVLLRMTSKLDITDFSSNQKSELEYYSEELKERGAFLEQHARDRLAGVGMSETSKQQTNKILSDLDNFISLLDLKMTKPAGLSSGQLQRQEQFKKGQTPEERSLTGKGMFMMSRHIM